MNQVSQNLPIIIVQGSTVIQTISYLDPDGNIIDLTGYTAQMAFRNTVEDTGEPIFELSTDDNSIVINGPTGTITYTISSTISAALTNGQQMVYNLFIYSPTNIVTALLAGPSYVQGSTIR